MDRTLSKHKHIIFVVSLTELECRTFVVIVLIDIQLDVFRRHVTGLLYHPVIRTEMLFLGIESGPGNGWTSPLSTMHSSIWLKDATEFQ